MLVKEWIQNERKANKKRYWNTVLCFIGMMIPAVALHIGIGVFSILLGSVFWVEKGVVFNNAVLENSILVLCFILLFVYYMVSVGVLLRTLGMGDYCIKVYSKEVRIHES